MPVTDGKSPVFDFARYDPSSQQFYLEAHLYPQDRFLTVSDVTSAPRAWFSADRDGIRAVPAPPPALYDVGPGGGIAVTSTVIRSIGTSEEQQPFGRHIAKTDIEEKTYEVTRWSGFPFFKMYKETVGDGTIRFTLSDGSTEVFALAETYKENSADYRAYFSPDGRFLLVLLPDEPDGAASQLPGHHQFLIVGPLPVSKTQEDIISILAAEVEETKRREAAAERSREYRSGEISAAEYYGNVYIEAERRARSCESLRQAIGELTMLALRPSVLDFGNPERVGKVFSFDYETESGSGTLQVISLYPEFRQSHGERYRDYIEGVDIRTSTGTTYVTCPVQ